MSAGHDVVFVLGQRSNQTCYFSETREPGDAKIPPRAEEHRRDTNGPHTGEERRAPFRSVGGWFHTLGHAAQTSATFSTNLSIKLGWTLAAPAPTPQRSPLTRHPPPPAHGYNDSS